MIEIQQFCHILTFQQDSFDSNSTPVTEPSVKAYHTFKDMRFYKFPLANGTIAQTCPAALGYGFAAGTTDWPGPLDFTQGANSTLGQNPLWAVVSGVLSTPTAEQKAVHVFPNVSNRAKLKLTCNNATHQNRFC